MFHMLITLRETWTATYLTLAFNADGNLNYTKTCDGIGAFELSNEK